MKTFNKPIKIFKSRAQVLIKTLQDIFNQIETKQVESVTFENIRDHELQAIPKRIDSLKEDVTRQAERERELQKDKKNKVDSKKKRPKERERQREGR